MIVSSINAAMHSRFNLSHRQQSFYSDQERFEIEQAKELIRGGLFQALQAPKEHSRIKQSIKDKIKALFQKKQRSIYIIR